MRKGFILFITLSLLFCSCNHETPNDNSAEASKILESTHVNNITESATEEFQTKSDSEFGEETNNESHAEISSEPLYDAIEHGDKVHLCCFRVPKANTTAKPEYLGGAILTLDDVDLQFTESEIECPESVIADLATEVLGKTRNFEEIICSDGQYEYRFHINMVNMTVEPSFNLPKNWNYQFGAPQIGSFKGYDGESAGAIDIENGNLFGYDERLTLGCSSWCGCQIYICEVNASSVLADQGKVNYKASHLSEENRENVWSEGVAGVGIGESIEIKQMYMGSGKAELSFYSICIVNGYAENETKWKENGRVKSMKLYYENEYMGLIALEDTINPQYIDISAVQMRVGNGFDANFRFEITEVYEGSKYEDTCLTGIVIDFEGIYAH